MISEYIIRRIAEWIASCFDSLLVHEVESANRLLRTCQQGRITSSIETLESRLQNDAYGMDACPVMEPVLVSVPNDLWRSLQSYTSSRVKELVARKTMADMLLRCDQLDFCCVLGVYRLVCDGRCMVNHWSLAFEKYAYNADQMTKMVSQNTPETAYVRDPFEAGVGKTGSRSTSFSRQSKTPSHRSTYQATASKPPSWRDIRWHRTMPIDRSPSPLNDATTSPDIMRLNTKLGIALRVLRQHLCINKEPEQVSSSLGNEHPLMECATICSISLYLPFSPERCIPVVQAAVLPRGFCSAKCAGDPKTTALVHTLTSLGNNILVPPRPHLAPHHNGQSALVIRLRIPQQERVLSVWETTQHHFFPLCDPKLRVGSGTSTSDPRNQLAVFTSLTEQLLNRPSSSSSTLGVSTKLAKDVLLDVFGRLPSAS